MSDFQPYDHEIIKIEEALRVINAYKPGMGFGEFAEAAEHEFYIRGFKISLVWVFPSPLPGGEEVEVPHGMMDFYMAARAGQRMPAPSPSISIIGRTSDQEFDHERMSWEVQHDILGIDPNPGALTKGGLLTPAKSTSMYSRHK